MKRRIFWSFIAGLFFQGVFTVYAQEEMNIWKEFVNTLMNGNFTPDMIKPYPGLPKEPYLDLAKYLKTWVSLKDFDVPPEINKVDDHIHYIISLTAGTEKVPYCFTILKEGNKWYYRHTECIFIRLDKISSLPDSTFPDVSEEKKAWMREEIYWSKQVSLFILFTKEKGKEFALNLFKDGAGYCLAAKTWVPFVNPGKAFILYLCWEQSNLRGNKVVLEKIEDSIAIIRMEPIYWLLYSRSSHLKRGISIEDYTRIFDTIWQDRAKSAGWNLAMTQKGDEWIFRFSK